MWDTLTHGRKDSYIAVETIGAGEAWRRLSGE